MKDTFTPPNAGEIPLVHTIRELYTIFYQLGNNLPKRDKLGIHQHIENKLFKILTTVIRASFEKRTQKIPTLETARVDTETLKHLIRIEYELTIIKEKSYVLLEAKLQEISKMINGWIKYLAKNPV